MSPRQLILFLASACALATSPVQAQSLSVDATPQISVSGTGVVRVAPDEVLLDVGVQTRHAQLQQATRDNAEVLARALAVIRQHGVPEKNIQANYIQVEADYDNDRSRTVPTAYRVDRRIALRLTDLSRFEALLTQLYAVGVNQVGDIQFQNTKLREHRDRARAMATQAAREKADALATQLGVKRGKALRIRESNQWSWGGGAWRSRDMRQQNMVQQAGGDAGADGNESLAAGLINITATVDVAFSIE